MTKTEENWHYWWATYEDARARFIYAKGLEAAKVEAATMGEVKTIKTLPYPSSGTPDGTPAFCYSPSSCAGRTACPRCPSCTS